MPFILTSDIFHSRFLVIWLVGKYNQIMRSLLFVPICVDVGNTVDTEGIIICSDIKQALLPSKRHWAMVTKKDFLVW